MTNLAAPAPSLRVFCEAKGEAISLSESFNDREIASLLATLTPRNDERLSVIASGCVADAWQSTYQIRLSYVTLILHY